MNPKLQIKAIAELDGFADCYIWAEDGETETVLFKIDKNSVAQEAKEYLTSRDAIVPLRIKVCQTQAVKVLWLNFARQILKRRLGKVVSDFDQACIEPAEDCEALLRATGKWVE